MSINSRTGRASSRLSSAGTLAASVLAILTASADAQAVTEWDLPEQPLAQSLRAIAAQSESNILFDKKLVNDQLAPPLKAKASAEQALTQVLEGSGLTYRHLDDKTVTIQLASTDPAATTSSAYRMQDGRIRLAQASTEPSAGERRLRIIDGRPLIDIEEIIVTGTNIRGVENTTVPLVVLDREYIQSSGISTTTRLLESLPQNFALANQSNTPMVGISDALTQGSAVNLRAIGEGTTLVLLNGRRLASGFVGSSVDISALPISAIERVEVLTDGASALYGSDAVGGVVNFILRSDFDGAETTVRGGSADGADEYSVSQVLGNTWESGNALFSVEYYKRDLLSSDERDFVPSTSTIGSLLPEDENYSAMFTGRQDLSGTITAFADALYTYRDSFNASGQLLQNENYSSENPQLSATVGLEWRLGSTWQLETSGSYANNDLEQVQRSDNPLLQLQGAPFTLDNKFTIEAARVKADGALFSIAGGQVRAAIGADWRSETFESSQVNARGVNTTPPIDLDQDVTSGFGELFIPVVGEANSMAGVHRLEVSLAARYDDYSEFGSSFDPKYGVAWEPVAGVKLRGSFGTSYVAPKLSDYNLASTRAFGLTQLDPGSPLGFSQQILLLGTDSASLRPQESDNLSLGLELTPLTLPGLQVAINYYDIEYTDRIANPPPGNVILGNPAAFGSLFIRNPTPAQIAEAIRQGQLGGNPFLTFGPFDPAATAVIVDARRRNLSVTNTSGLDLLTRYDFAAGGNNFSVGVAGTYVFELDQQVTTTSPEVDTVETYANPPHWRARASFGWRRAGWSSNLFVNHTDSYTDNRVPTPVEIGSFTTVDLRVAYDFSSQVKGGLLSGFTVAAGAINLLDKDPPRTAVFGAFDIGFDPSNASPLGRLISIELIKAW